MFVLSLVKKRTGGRSAQQRKRGQQPRILKNAKINTGGVASKKTRALSVLFKGGAAVVDNCSGAVTKHQSPSIPAGVCVRLGGTLGV